MSLKHQYLSFLNSTSLWNSGTSYEFSIFNFEELIKNAIHPEIVQINIGENEVLGKRVEHFFEYCITSSDRYDLLAKNIQVFDHKITIGELDFIVKDLQQNKVLHIELVCKFYLYDTTLGDGLETWIGPNRKDSLLQKVKKLTLKQFPLLYKKETKPILENLQLDVSKINQQACFISYLFVPITLKHHTFPMINNNCIVGFWEKSNAFTDEQYGNYQFYIPQKKDWISNPKYYNTWFSFEEILPQIQTSLLQKKSPLLWMKENEDSYARFFVVWW
ncbi:DUF1853 family protein [Aquimarina algiphila]|uniref:DUF1853 family protein n=1 Tax=Aquimarina algiphila TaxID=2047982 RepID=UPI002493CDBA|nr:DUF1853 family protein [Aquimarina algiphila]